MKTNSEVRSWCTALALAGLPPLACAAEAPRAAGELEEIIVTAQFIEQSAQTAPLAITALSGESLEARGIADTASLGAQVPNVQLSQGGSFYGNSVIAFIRGVGQPDSAPAVEPGVGFYVDDVFYSTTAGTLLDLLDLDRVEILRGPQGTLAGKNSIGGAVKLYSRKPGPNPDAHLELTRGSFDFLKVRAGGNVTLVENELYARLSGVSSSRDGHVKRYDFGCLYPGSGLANNYQGNTQGNCRNGTLGGTRSNAARVALSWTPNETLDVQVAGDVSDDRSEASATVLLATGPTAPVPIFDSRIPGLAWDAVNLGFNPSNPLSGPPVFGATIPPCVYVPYGSGACPTQVAALGGSYLNDPYASFATFEDLGKGLSVPAQSTLRSRGVSGQLHWKLDGGLELQSITGYRDYDMAWGLDQDASPISVATLNQSFAHSQFTQELRLLGGAANRLTWTLGGFYLDAKTLWAGRIDIGYGGVDFAHGPDPINARSWAAFANGIWKFTDRLQLAAGVRYSDDRKDYTFNRRNPDLTVPGACIGPPGTPGNPANCALAPLNGIVSTYSGNRVDYRAALSYFFAEESQVYGSVSTGYKSGGVNARPFFPAQALAHDPEELTTYEVGLKSDLLGNRLRVNMAFFLNDYRNIVLGLGDCSSITGPAFGTPCFLPANAGKADMKGAELETVWLPMPGLQIDSSFGWLDFSFKKINPSTGLTLDTVPPFTARYRASLGIQYDIKAPFGVISPRIDASYQDDIYTEALNTPYNLIPSYTLVNASLRWRNTNGDWQAGLEVRNLTDKLHYLGATDLFSPGGGAASAVVGLPRTFAVSVRRNF